jgi:hypothetical protein
MIYCTRKDSPSITDSWVIRVLNETWAYTGNAADMNNIINNDLMKAIVKIK